MEKVYKLKHNICHSADRTEEQESQRNGTVTMEMKIAFVTLLITIGFVKARPQYGHGSDAGPVGYGGGHNAMSNAYSNSNGYNHDFGYAVEDPKYGNYQGRQESGSGNSVRGTYYLMEADGSLRRVDYVADHPGGFRATVTDKHGSRSFGQDSGYNDGNSDGQHGGRQH